MTNDDGHLSKRGRKQVLKLGSHSSCLGTLLRTGCGAGGLP